MIVNITRRYIDLVDGETQESYQILALTQSSNNSKASVLEIYFLIDGEPTTEEPVVCIERFDGAPRASIIGDVVQIGDVGDLLINICEDEEDHT